MTVAVSVDGKYVRRLRVAAAQSFVVEARCEQAVPVVLCTRGERDRWEPERPVAMLLSSTYSDRGWDERVFGRGIVLQRSVVDYDPRAVTYVKVLNATEDVIRVH